MKLFHASSELIKQPDVFHGRKNADFGQGFYLSPDRDFVNKWAGENFYINEYKLDLEGLKVVEFERNQDWFEYIFNNRRRKDTIEADVVIGPVANDTLYDSLGIITSGYLSNEEALSLLMIGPEYRQVAIKTIKGIKQLHWLDAMKIIDVTKEKELLKQEEEQYNEDFAKAMEKFDV